MSPQQIIAHYRVIGKLGQGGMGTIYRAVDTKLGREVAIKVLPEAFARDPDRLTRFTREARVLASLNHPNIAAIYGVEENALVMELVEGLTLAERIAQGPMPLDEALVIAGQIAEALEYAHEKGIVHRDLKPANVKVTPEGRVKVLDFGLAKALAGETAAGDPEASPTITMDSTVAGVILGTAGYMAPEQARGKAVDKRADIWAFGVVLYELLTGKRLFAGETVSDTLAGVLTKEPDLTAVPLKVRRLMGRCLEKDAKKRLRDIGDYAGFLDDAPGVADGKRSGILPWLIAALAAVAALALTVWLSLRPEPLAEVTRFQIFAPPGSTIPLGTPAPSPDGRMLAYTVRGKDGIARIYVRSLNSTESRVLPDTDGASHPFWSPDGRSLGFSAPNSLKRIDLAGGSAGTLASTTGPWHGSWNQAGVILFQAGGIQKIPAEGGATTPVVKLDAAKAEIGSGFPFFLGDGKRFLTLIIHGDGTRNIELATLGLTERKLILPGLISAPILASAPNGRTYLLYLREDSLEGQEFDEKAAIVRGSAFLLIDRIGVVGTPPIRPSVGVSPSVLAYQAASNTDDNQLAWIDHAGKPLKDLTAPAGENPALSPDGRWVAVNRRTATGSDVWLVDLSRGSPTRFTFGSTGRAYAHPLWSPDGKRVAYLFQSGGIFLKDANGVGREEKVWNSPATPLSWSPDGRQILCSNGSSLFLLPVDGDRTPVPVGPGSNVPFNRGGQVSPDGKYVAFPSSESGRLEIYIEPMPPGTGKWQISSNGGVQPKWRHDGKELFFLSLESKLMAVDIQAGHGIMAGVPHALFQTAITDLLGAPYDVSSDGQRFLVGAGRSASSDAPITVVLNWWAGLKTKEL